MENRIFFPQIALDQWGIDAAIELTATDLILLSEGRRYKIAEAVRVVAEVTGANDEHKLVGKVKPKALLEQLGAEILENSMIIGENAYDVVPGWMATPSGPFQDHLMSPERMKARGGKTDVGAPPRSDEELVSRFVEGGL